MVVRIFLALLTLGVLGLAIASVVYMVEKVQKPRVAAVRELKETAPPKPIDPGLREYDAAIELVKDRKLVAARDKLRYIIRYFPMSDRYQSARRLCGEINLDLLVSPNYSEDKTVYEVQRGDSLSAIAKKHGTTIEYLKRINGMIDFKIQPGDQIMVRPLDFRFSLESKSKRLQVMEGDEFFAEYSIARLVWPGGVRPPFEDSLRSKGAWLGETSVRSTEDGYDRASKQLKFRKPRVVMLGEEPGEGESAASEETKPGIYMDPADIEELTMLLRADTPINVL